MKIINEVANKYKVIAMDTAALTDDLYDATNFSRYSFMTSFSTEQDREGAWPIITGRSGKRKKSFTSSARTICSDMPWPTGLKRG